LILNKQKPYIQTGRISIHMAQNSKTQESSYYQNSIIIHSTIEETKTNTPTKITRICWNTGEEKNCTACYLRKGCKARA